MREAEKGRGEGKSGDSAQKGLRRTTKKDEGRDEEDKWRNKKKI